MCSGWVQALKTRLRGASKTRVMTSSRVRELSTLLVCAIMVILFWTQSAGSGEILIEAVQRSREALLHRIVSDGESLPFQFGRAMRAGLDSQRSLAVVLG